MVTGGKNGDSVYTIRIDGLVRQSVVEVEFKAKSQEGKSEIALDMHSLKKMVGNASSLMVV